MAAEIVIVSGFLGAGKTTLIQQWLDKGVFSGKTAIIENDFGGAGVDATLLRSGDVTVTELNEGCICCSLAGDFVRALEELTAQYAPDTILIEPSGVGMLSDVRRACSHPRIAPLARVRCAVTIVDIRRMSRYQASFGVFYEDQIRRADAIVLSRVEQHPELIPAALERIFALNADARVFAEPWAALNPAEILAREAAPDHKRVLIGRRTERTPRDVAPRMAEEVFDTVTVHTNRAYTASDLHERFLRAEQCGMLIRAKGIVPSEGGFLLAQYTLGETQLEATTAPGNFLCFIGQGLDAVQLNEIFLGD